VYVAYPCDAQLSAFTASPTINLIHGPADTYFGAGGMEHMFHWEVKDLWNCDLTAKYSVKDTNEVEWKSKSMTFDELYAFAQTTDEWMGM